MKKINKRVLAMFLVAALSVTPIFGYAEELAQPVQTDAEAAIEEAIELTKNEQSLEEIVKAYFEDDLSASDAVKSIKIVSDAEGKLDVEDCVYLAKTFGSLEKLDVREAVFASKEAYDYFLDQEADETCVIDLEALEYLYTEDAAYIETEAAETEPVETEAEETEAETETDAIELFADKVIADHLELGTVDAAKGTYQIKLIDCVGTTKGSLTAPVTEVSFVVWSTANGTDDRKTYKAVQNGSEWIFTVDLSNHNYEAGEFNVQAYATDGYDVHNYVGGMKFTTTAPTTNVMTTTVSADEKTVKLVLDQPQLPANVRYVSVAVWGEKNGTADRKWYTAKKNSAGQYEYTVKIADHKETGKYQAQYYAIGTGSNTKLAGATFTISNTTARVSVAGKDTAKGTFTMCLSNIVCPADVTGVNFVVYSVADGNKDQRTWKATKTGSFWQAKVDIAYHEGVTGDYAVFAYAADARGISTMVGKLVYNVPVPTVKPAIKAVVNEKVGQVTLTVTDLIGAKDVSIPVWGDANGKNDIHYYTPSTKDNRTWTVTVPLYNHLEKGNFNAHVYATIAGKRAARCTTTFKINNISSNLIYITDRNAESGTYRVNILNPTGLANLDDILVATWTNKDGQDDIKWLKMTKGANNIWSVTIDPVDHAFEKGAYISHLYLCNPAGERKMVGGITSNVDFTAKYGFVKEGDKTYYYVRLNEKAKGELRLNGQRYYFDPKTGEMAVGWKYINGYKYYFDKDGKMVQDVYDILGLQSRYHLKLNRILNCMVLYAWNPETESFSIPVKAFRTSTGDDTPLGSWTLKETYRWMGMYNGTAGQYTVQIVGPYFLHSVCYTTFGDPYSLMPLGYNALGVNKSAGCVRLRVIDAKLLYDLKNAGLLYTIDIFDSSDYGPFDWPYYGTIPETQTWEPTDPSIPH